MGTREVSHQIAKLWPQNDLTFPQDRKASAHDMSQDGEFTVISVAA